MLDASEHCKEARLQHTSPVAKAFAFRFPFCKTIMYTMMEGRTSYDLRAKEVLERERSRETKERQMFQKDPSGSHAHGKHSCALRDSRTRVVR
jgi:hypothetical protein